jgi:uncharacterized protein (TIGR02246 family)
MTSAAVLHEPETAARTMLAALEAAWNDGDGDAFGALYAPDASFVTVRGDHAVGSRAIGEGHARIFATIYAGSVNRMELVQAREVGPGLVLAVSVNTLRCPSGPMAGEHKAMSTSVIAADDKGSSWRVVATQNTLLAA